MTRLRNKARTWPVKGTLGIVVLLAAGLLVAGAFGGVSPLGFTSSGGTGASPSGSASPAPHSSAAPVATSRTAASNYLVTFSQGTSSATQAAAISAAGATRISSIAPLSMATIKVPAGSTRHVLAALRANANVADIALNQSRQSEGSLDPAYANQWNLAQIGWDQLHGKVNPHGSPTIAVLDTGVSRAGGDLNLLKGWSAFKTKPTKDPNGHGTAVASIAAAATGNGIGVAGVNFARARILPVQVLNSNGLGLDSDIVKGIVWAANHRAKVILMSFSNPGYSKALQKAVKYAWRKGAVIVAATGNGSSTVPTYPAGIPGVIGVAGTDQSDAPWASSNTGADAFIAAPATSIPADATNGSETSITGTSASAAMVAGAAALLFAKDAHATNGIVVGRLARNADAVGTTGQTGNGRLNVAKAYADKSTKSVKPLGAPGGGPIVAPYATAAACSWKTTPTDGNWSTGSNWTGCSGTGTAPNKIPAAGDDLTIPTGATAYPTLSAAGVAKTINIVNGASVTVTTGGTLTMSGAITDNGSLTVSGSGVLTGNQNLTVGAGDTATFSSSGTSDVATLSVTGTASVSAGTVTPSTLTINALGQFSQTGGTTTINGGADTTIAATGTLSVSGGSFTTPTNKGFSGAGAFQLSGSGTVTVGTAGTGGADFKTTGTVALSGGTLKIGHDFKPDPTQLTSTGGTIDFLGGAGGGAFGTAGTYNFFNVQIESGADPAMDNSANQINAAGSWTFIGNPAGTFGISANKTWTAGALFFGAVQQASGTWGHQGNAAHVDTTKFPANTNGLLNVSSTAATRLVITGSASQTAGTSQNLTITAKDAGGATALTYTGDKSLTFSGASTIGAFTPTVTDKTGTVVNFGTAETITFTNGVATVSGGNNGAMTLYKAEAATIAVTDGSISAAGADRLSVTVSATTADATQSTLTPTSASITAGTGTQVLTVQAKDQYGNNRTTGGSTVVFSNQSGTGSVGSTTDNGNGTYTATVTAPNLVGSGVFVATLGGSPVKSGTGSQTTSTITYTPGAADATQSTLTPTSASITAGTGTQVLTVQAKDQFGNSLTAGGSTVVFSNQSGTGSVGSTTDNGNGTYTATVTAPNLVGSGVFVATLGGSPVKSGTGSQTTSTITYTPGVATKLAITSVPSNATVDTNFSVTVESQDAFGNCAPVIANTGISLASDGAGTLSGNTGTITAATCTVTLTSVQTTLNETIHLTASRTSGDSLTTSAASSAIVVAKANFVTNTDVSIDGTPTVGTDSTVTPGDYTPTPTGTSYQWRLCDSAGNNCNDIGGATSAIYTPVPGDVGGTLRVVETVTKAGYNNGGSTSAASPVVIKGDFVINLAVSIDGTPQVDTPTTLTAGSYSPAATSTSYQWRLCDSAGNNCNDIGGATSSTYTPVAGDVGGTLRVVETASKAGYNDATTTSDASPVVIKADFVTNTDVSINGTPKVGVSSTLTAGSYTPTPTGTSYQWQWCDSAGNNCADIGGANLSTYTPVAGDVGGTLRVVETVTKAGYNDGGSTSAASPVVINGDFTTNTAVSINGTPKVDVSTTLTAGSYTPTPTGTTYQWRLCDSAGNNCADIGGANSSTYTPVAGDVGGTLRVVETVTKAGYNDGGSTSAASPVVIKNDFTTNTAVSINGTPTVGTASTLTAGSYTPTPTGTSYQWQLCDSAGNNCNDIGGATSSTYTPVAGDVGGTLRVVETVTKAGYNDGGSTSAASPVVILGDFVTNTSVSINGTPKVGVFTTLTAGTYTPTPTGYSYQWRLCDSGGGSCADISGATNSTYKPVAGDVGGTLRVVETVTKAGYNNASTTSAASPVVIKGDFTISSDVTINGTPTVGTPSTITNVVNSPTATTRTQQWQLCDSGGGSCVDISGEMGMTYTPVPSDVGSTLRVVQTITRAGYNDAVSTSSASAIVIKGDFTTTTAVAINGTPTVDTATTLTAGTYSPTPTSSAYQWRLCDMSGNNCSDIGGATSSTYTPVAGDVGSTLRVVETVSKSGYNDASSTSDRATVVAAPITTNTAVSINGTPQVATATTLTQGSYTPTPTSRTYQWRLCDSGGGSCANISGATSSTYTPVAGDVGSTLRVVETVSKAGYSTTSSTSAAGPLVIKANFTTNTAVAINGTPKVATASTLTAGNYTPAPTSRTYQWRLCDSGGGSCADIGGATNSTYTPVAGDVGGTLRVVETVTKAGYNNSSSTSAASPVVIKASFTNTVAVAINGTPTVGTASTLTAGTYTPAPTGTSYQWRLCDSAGNTCADIGGATTSTYTPVSGDIGGTLRVVETVTKAGYNNAGSTSAASPVVRGVFATNTAVAIVGTPKVGVQSTTTGGTYTPSPVGRSYQWQRCAPSGLACVTITGATNNTYTPVAADAGKTLRVIETVTKPNYVSGSSTSAASPLVALGTFSKDYNPEVFGYPQVGVTSSITQGAYTPAPTSRTYQWLRCTSTTNASCTEISGATNSTYKPVAADAGKRLRVVETVSRAGYNDFSATSSASTVVTS